MKPQQNQTQIIEASLLKWISILTKSKIQNFQELIQGHFYLDFLKKIQNFKLLKPLKSLQLQPSLNSPQSFQSKANISLANKVLNMKTIGQYIISYYKTSLKRDISEMKINYVQLCMGNSSQSIKLFSLLIGIFSSNQNGAGYQHLTQAIQDLEDENDQYIVRALLENTKSIGADLSKKEIDSPMKQKMIDALQIYEEKIEGLQEMIEKLKSVVQEEKNKVTLGEIQIKQLKSQTTKLIQKSEVLQVLNSRLQSDNTSLILQNQSLTKKLQYFKRKYQKSQTQLSQKSSLYQIQQKQSLQLIKNIQELKKVNQQLRNQINQRQDYWKGQQMKYKLMKKNYDQMKEKIKLSQEKYLTLEQEYENYRAGELYRTNNKVNNILITHNNQSSIQSSLKYRAKNNLGSQIRNPLEFDQELQQYELVNSRGYYYSKDRHYENNINGKNNVINNDSFQIRNQKFINNNNSQNKSFIMDNSHLNYFNNMNTSLVLNNISNNYPNQNQILIIQDLQNYNTNQKNNFKTIRNLNINNNNLNLRYKNNNNQIQNYQTNQFKYNNDDSNNYKTHNNNNNNKLQENLSQSLIIQDEQFHNKQKVKSSFDEQRKQKHQKYQKYLKQFIFNNNNINNINNSNNKQQHQIKTQHLTSDFPSIKKQQIHLYIIMIQTLLSQNNILSFQLSKYENLKKSQQNRKKIFINKLKKIRQIQPIIQQEQPLQNNMQGNSQNKQNNNTINLFPLSLITKSSKGKQIRVKEQAQNKEFKENKAKNNSNKSQKCPYYQIMHI